MKNAEEYLSLAYLVIKENQDSSHLAVDPPILEAMKEYAKQVAEQALKDAADKFLPSASISRGFILNTPIKTP